jgi:hypothetical protein
MFGTSDFAGSLHTSSCNGGAILEHQDFGLKQA